MFWGKKIINLEFSDPIYLWKLHVTALNYIKPDTFFKMLLKDSLLKGKKEIPEITTELQRTTHFKYLCHFYNVKIFATRQVQRPLMLQNF